MPSRMLLTIMVLLGAVVAVRGQDAPAQAAGSQRATIEIPRVSAPPRLEQFLIDNGPRPGTAVSGFLQRDPGDLVPATDATTAYLSYDAEHLYVVFVCGTPDPSRIRARMSRREAMFADDVVGVMLDTFRDRQRAYMFFTNAFGVQADGIFTEGREDDFNFDTVWHSRGTRTPFGYVVLMAIPFKSLRFAPGAGPQTWGLALKRWSAQTNEHTFWPGITRRVSAFTSQFADARGFDGVSPGRTVQAIPYGTFTAARFLENGRFEREAEGRVGIDAKLIVRDAITFDVTANPDFSQVESDEPQVTVNQRFEVFFPEKRPFFLENADYFQTPLTLFFSRRVRDPQAGVRVTGKVRGWALGAVAIDDRNPGRVLPAADPLHGDRAFNGVVRARREFGESSVGALVTSRDFGPSSNRIASVDTRLRLNPQWFFNGQAAYGDTRALDRRPLDDTAYRAELHRSGRMFTWDLTYEDIGADFRSPLGFVPRTDVRAVTSFAMLRWRPTSGALAAFGPNSFAQTTWDRKGELQDWLVRFPFSFEFRGNSSLFGRRAQSMERFEGREFHEHENLVNFYSGYISWLEVFAQVANGTRPNFYPAPGLAPALANYVDANVTLTFRPTAKLALDEIYFYSRLTLRSAAPAAATIFDNHILRSRANYQFNHALSLRAIVDYNAVLSNPALVALDRTKRITADVLLTYLVHPGTALYVGFTDGYENLVVSPGGMTLSRRPTMSTGRQFFVKSSYLFRF